MDVAWLCETVHSRRGCSTGITIFRCPQQSAKFRTWENNKKESWVLPLEKFSLLLIMRKGLQFSFNIRSKPVFFDLWPLFTTSLHPTNLRPIPSLFGRATRRGMESFASSGPSKTCSPVEYMPLEDIERPERYHPGGYHPIVIGDCLGDRYDVVHKLGFGTYSTTWLARDRKTKKYVAVKITVADADMQESKILGSLALSNLKDEGHPGKALIPQVLDKFLVDGPNGRHRCLVTEPGMMSLAEAKDASYCRLFELPVAKAITAQVIQAVAFLHHRGIVHAGIYIWH